VLRIAHELLRPLEGSGAETDLAGMLTAARPVIRRRSLVVVISDFISRPGWERPLDHLARRHDVVAVRLVDDLEGELPDLGVVVVEDAETGEQLLVDTSDPGFRARFLAASQAREATLLDPARRAGVDVHVVSTGEDLAHALVRLVVRRSKRRTA
jgi:uncharacterized protein (DUF58 family)